MNRPNVDKAVKLYPLAGWPDHRAGSDGRIYSSVMSKGREFRPLKPGLGSTGYEHVVMCRGGEHTPRLVHLLVAEAFHGSRPEGFEASHKNGNQRDNQPSNLTWETHSENLRRRAEHGTDDKGLKNSRACVDKVSLMKIRKRVRDGGTNKGIAKEFGVSSATISRIRSGKRFAND